MSAPPPGLPPRSSSALLPTLAAVTYVALLIAFWGVLSLALDRDVIDYTDAPTLLGPAMAGAAAVVTWVVLLVRGGAPRPRIRAAISTVGSLLAMLVVAVIGYAPVAAAHFAISPFVLGAAALSGCTALAVGIAGRSPRREPPRGPSALS